jgi:predicted nucleic acid-binding protein
MSNILIDSCFWFALFDKSDEHYDKAQNLSSYLEFGKIILPFPILYETLNTRFVKRKEWTSIFYNYLNNDSTILISDELYRKKALSNTLNNSINSIRPLSLVDMTIRFMLDDINLNINALITFNKKDFVDLCSNKGIELISE